MSGYQGHEPKNKAAGQQMTVSTPAASTEKQKSTIERGLLGWHCIHISGVGTNRYNSAETASFKSRYKEGYP